MKPPPFLIGATLLFWGWQSDLLIPGAIMALAFEGGRWVKVRWAFTNEDFTRIWVFCTFLFLATVTISPFSIFTPSFLLSYSAVFFLIVSTGGGIEPGRDTPRDERLRAATSSAMRVCRQCRRAAGAACCRSASRADTAGGTCSREAAPARTASFRGCHGNSLSYPGSAGS